VCAHAAEAHVGKGALVDGAIRTDTLRLRIGARSPSAAIRIRIGLWRSCARNSRPTSPRATSPLLSGWSRTRTCPSPSGIGPRAQAASGRAFDGPVDGRLELVSSTRLLQQIAVVLARPLPQRYLRRGSARIITDAGQPPTRPADCCTAVCRDPHDDYLVAVHGEQRDPIVTGDPDVLAIDPMPGACDNTLPLCGAQGRQGRGSRANQKKVSRCVAEPCENSFAATSSSMTCLRHLDVSCVSWPSWQTKSIALCRSHRRSRPGVWRILCDCACASPAARVVRLHALPPSQVPVLADQSASGLASHERGVGARDGPRVPSCALQVRPTIRATMPASGDACRA
jgi:predicted nucleic acid-binding protein